MWWGPGQPINKIPWVDIVVNSLLCTPNPSAWCTSSHGWGTQETQSACSPVSFQGPMNMFHLYFFLRPSLIAFKFCCCLVTQSFPTLGTPWTVAHQAPLFLGFSRQEYWSELPFPSPRDLADSGIKALSPVLQVDPLPLSHLGSLQSC